MSGSILGAGWPFAWLLHWNSAHANGALQSGVIAKNDRRGRLLVRKQDGATDAIELDGATPVFGVDGYPLSFHDLRIGDLVAVVHERRGLELVPTEVHLLRPL
jgi:hypothetical protein